MNFPISQLSYDELDEILSDAFDWLLENFDDSIRTNKLNYTKKYSPLKPYTFKHHLKLEWHYKAKKINWHYYKQYAQYDTRSNTLQVHCRKDFTLEFVLACLFHEYKHAQQDMFGYSYYKGSYVKNPYEVEADEFAEEHVLDFWSSYIILKMNFSQSKVT